MTKLKEAFGMVMLEFHNVFVESRKTLNVTFIAKKAIDLEMKRF